MIFLVLVGCRGDATTAQSTKPEVAQVNPTGSSGCSTATPAFAARTVALAGAALAPYAVPASGALAADATQNFAYVAIPGPAPGPAILKLDIDGGSMTVFADAARFAAFDPLVSALTGIAILDSQTILVIDASTNRVLEVTDTNIESFAGVSNPPGGFADGPTNACTFRFSAPVQLAIGGNGAVFLPDPGNHRLRKISKGNVSTVAGSGIPGFADGIGAEAHFDTPDCVAIECNGSLVMTEASHRVRRVTFKLLNSGFFGSQTVGEVTTLAGNGDPLSLDGTGGPDGDARVDTPGCINVGTDGTIFWIDRGSGMLRKIDPPVGGLILVTSPYGAPVAPPASTFGLAAGFAQGLLLDSAGNQVLKF
jgi:hypothetical protein